LEIVSPGNKSGKAALARFVEKTVDFLEAGVHVLVVDLFPPSVRDPQGIPWEAFHTLDSVPVFGEPDASAPESACGTSESACCTPAAAQPTARSGAIKCCA
jgi:hypothetical protein